MEEVGWLFLPLAYTPSHTHSHTQPLHVSSQGEGTALHLIPPSAHSASPSVTLNLQSLSQPEDVAWLTSAADALREAAKYVTTHRLQLLARFRQIQDAAQPDGIQHGVLVSLCCELSAELPLPLCHALSFFHYSQEAAESIGKTFGPKEFSLTSVYGEIKREHMTRWRCGKCCSVARAPHAESQQESALCLLSVDVLQLCCEFLTACAISRTRGTCRYLFEKLQRFIPAFTLRLHTHQELALEWMEQREQLALPCSSVCTSCRFNLNVWRANPRFHLLQGRPKAGHRPGKALCIDLLTGQVFTDLSKVQLGHVRGGLLCDEPGLGKTVTLIALLLKTFNKFPKAFSMTDEAVEKRYLAAAHDGWLEWDVIYRRQALTRLLSALRKHKQNDWFHYPVDVKHVPDYARIISSPIDMQTIGRRVEKGAYDTSLDLFESALELCYDNAQQYNPPEHPIHQDAKVMQQHMRKEVKKLRRLAGMYNCRHEESDLTELHIKSKLVVSRGTLVVVPLPLMNHWREQLTKAVNLQFLGGELSDHVYMDMTGSGKLPSAEALASYWVVVIPTRRASTEYGKAAETMAFDGNTIGSSYVSPLQRIYWLRLVVDEGHTMGSTSTTNLARFLKEVQAERSWVLSGTPTKDVDLRTSLKTLAGLLRYMRHPVFGEAKRGSVSSAQAWRALVSGPFVAKQATGYRRLKGLLCSLMAKTSKADVHIPKPVRKLTKLTMSAFERKYYNLRCAFIMTNVVLTVKLDGRIQEESLLHTSQRREAAMQMRNIRLMCSGGGRLVCSITDLNRELTRRMLASPPCPNPACRERHAWRRNPEGFHARGPREHPEICAKHGASGFGKSEAVVKRVDRFIGRTITGRTTLCGGCNIDLELLIVLPCGCFFCFECIKRNYLQCSICHSSHTFDEIQLLQPGFSIDWHESLLEAIADARDRAAARNSSNLVVSRGALEVAHDGLVQEWQGGVKSKYIWERLVALRQESRAPKVIVFSQFAQALNLVGHDLILRFGQDAVAEFSGKYRSAELEKFKHNKASSWRCTRCGLKNQQADSRCRGLEAKLKFEAENLLPEEETWVRWDLITGYNLGRQYRLGEQVLYRTRIGVVVENRRCGCSRFGSKQHKPADVVVEDVDCFVLLLGVDGSHGLDLSFVTHIFLLDKIWNPSLEKQVVARAYRMGSTKSVEIETLIMKDTIEDLMLNLELNQNGDETETEARYAEMNGLVDHTLSVGSIGDQGQQHFQIAEMRKLHYLLRRIRLVREAPEKKHVLHDKEDRNGTSGTKKRIRFNV